MARTIVIVDDEKLVLYGIYSLLAENDTGYHVSATCSSGEEGFRYCIDNPPDILLTDIGMPGMTGLEVIEKIRQINRNMKIIVLSCHDEYRLVHKAFILGADDYILKKDIDKESLLETLDKLFPQDTIRKSFTEQRGMIPNLVNISDSVSEITGSLGIIGFKSDYLNDNEETFWQPDIPMLHQLIKEEIHSSGLFYLGLRNDLVIHFSDPKYMKEPVIDRYLERIRLSISKYINRPVFIARYIISEPENILQSYKEGLKILDGLFYYNKSSVLTRPTKSPSWKSPLIFSISGCSPEQIWRTEVDDFFRLSVKQWASPDAVKSELIFAIKYLLHHIQGNEGENAVSESKNQDIPYYQKIASFNDLEKLKNWIYTLLNEIYERLESGRYGCSIVSKARLFITENLQQDLRLSLVADILGVNANHLSTIFKRETGQTYSEYVNRMRIKRARELLETTDLSAKAIAFRCGYPNPNYFSRIFKKLTDLTVSEYRIFINDNS